MGTAREFIAVTHPVSVGIAAQTVAVAIEAFIRERATAIIAQREEVEVAGRGVGATRCKDAASVAFGGGRVEVARRRIGAPIARVFTRGRSIGGWIVVAGLGFHAPHVGHGREADFQGQRAGEGWRLDLVQGVVAQRQGEVGFCTALRVPTVGCEVKKLEVPAPFIQAKGPFSLPGRDAARRDGQPVRAEAPAGFARVASRIHGDGQRVARGLTRAVIEGGPGCVIRRVGIRTSTPFKIAGAQGVRVHDALGWGGEERDVGAEQRPGEVQGRRAIGHQAFVAAQLVAVHLEFEAGLGRKGQGVRGGGPWGQPYAPVQHPSEGVAQHPSVLGSEAIRREGDRHVHAILDAKRAFRAGVVGDALVGTPIDLCEQHGEVRPTDGSGNGGEGQVHAVPREQHPVPQGVPGSASEVPVLQVQLVKGLGSEVVHRHHRTDLGVTVGTSRGEDAAEGGIPSRGVGQVQRVDAPTIGGGHEPAGRGMQDQVGDDHIGQSVRQAGPGGSRRTAVVNPDIGTGIGVTGAANIDGQGVHRGWGQVFGKVRPAVSAVGGVQDLGVVVVVGQGNPELVGIGGVDLDVGDPGESIGHIQRVKGLSVRAPVQVEFLGHIQATHIT